MNIILMGYRCTGKTSAGKRLAERLGRSFYDTDEMVERQTGLPIPRIVAEQGWDAFRQAEGAAIRELSCVDCCVIALGGGAVLDSRNVENLKRNGVFVWLMASAKTIAARMGNDEAGGSERPSLTQASSIGEIDPVLSEREPLYRRLADLAVDTTEIDADRVAETICTGLRKQFPQTEGIN
ncbi:MAG: shikimate kinase [Syntrophobacterales bacterium CG_4_8_14_3_um_filter_58_8]|nr:MAG: shikimate kinase [Syntrophobacterales bacterium CG03_land_8_20_14_0_80_58_14]PJC71750.1 MAG: shikimate kinase [Syntrophobacterales bacterium CG_4_8_14_3_um_filter_58_8]